MLFGSTELQTNHRFEGVVRMSKKLIAVRFFAFALLCVQWDTGTAVAQLDIEEIEQPLIDQQPFDLVIVVSDKGGESVKVAPLDFRTMPTAMKPTDKLEVTILKFADRRYEISWKYIDKILFYEQRIYDEAQDKMAKKDFIGAFQNLSFLMKEFPEMPNLEGLRQQFIFQSASDRYLKKGLRQTLSAMEELKATAPDFQTDRVTTAISTVADQLITEYQENGNLGSAQTLLYRIKDRYGATLPVVEKWENKLEAMALKKKQEAERYVESGNYRMAWKAAVQALAIFPDLQEVLDLMEEINRTYPMIRVGVMQRSGNLDPAALVDWPARRAGALVSRPLFRYLKTGNAGGSYGFALGTYRASDDRKQLLLTLSESIQTAITPGALAQQLVQRADPEHRDYDPSFAAIFESVEVKGRRQVQVNLRRPNVLPHALMQWLLPNDPQDPSALPGDYRLAAADKQEASFKLRPELLGEQNKQPVEIVEMFYADPKEAVNDLLRGDIDVLDQLYPADAQRLSTDRRLKVGRYALPTSHMLIPISDHPFLKETSFRRALLCATDRQSMLTGELLNSENTDDGRLISGPFPIGRDENDPLAYAYNEKVKETQYNPPLARLLVLKTQDDLTRAAAKKREPIPEYKKLIVGCPDFEFARVATQAMIQQWKPIGIEAEMVMLTPDQISKDAPCDLIYVVTTMWEPATDIERLLGGNGIARTDDPYLIQGLELLRESRNWREIRTALRNMHQLVDYHLPVLPLWQVADRYAVTRKVEGIEDNTVSLYQNVDEWRVKIESAVPVSRK